MSRKILSESQVHPTIADQVGGAAEYRATVDEVEAAIQAHDIVIVGMRQNPYPKQARKLLDARGIDYHYLEYGSYFAEWKRRGALKMWSGWQTLPMVFVKGQLIGGKSDLETLLDQDQLQALLA